MALCKCCGQDKAEALTCTRAVMVQRRLVAPVRYGREANARADAPERCPSCGVLKFGIHHPGCEVEECPQCHRLFTDCGCGAEAAALAHRLAVLAEVTARLNQPVGSPEGFPDPVAALRAFLDMRAEVLELAQGFETPSPRRMFPDPPEDPSSDD